MKLNIKAHANLRHYLSGNRDSIILEIENNKCIKDIITLLEIPDSEVWKAVIKGNIVGKDYNPSDNDTIDFFPILAGG